MSSMQGRDGSNASRKLSLTRRGNSCLLRRNIRVRGMTELPGKCAKGG